jgi:hypothetical protein
MRRDSARGVSRETVATARFNRPGTWLARRRSRAFRAAPTTSSESIQNGPGMPTGGTHHDPVAADLFVDSLAEAGEVGLGGGIGRPVGEGLEGGDR